MSVYEVGGSIGEIYYSYDIWKLAQFLWQRWNQVMPVHTFSPFFLLSDDTKKKLLNIAFDIHKMIREVGIEE